MNADLDDQKEHFTQLLNQIQQHLFAYIFSLVHNIDDAQEVYQQTCLVLWRRFGDFSGNGEFSTWACGIARNKVADLRKVRSRYQARFSDGFEDYLAGIQVRTPVDEFDDRRDALDSCLKKLPDGERRLVRDCYESDTPVPEVARQLSRTPHSVYNSLRRVRTKLLACIARALARRRARRGE